MAGATRALWKTEEKCIQPDETRKKTGYLEIRDEMERERGGMEPTVRLELTTC